jgi:hypothetical protein
MLKTQLSKAVYLSLFCVIASSFVTSSHSNSPILLPEERINSEVHFAKETMAFTMSDAPQVNLSKQELRFANNYIKTSAESLIDIKQRSKIPFTIIDSVFSRYGLPVQLKYLAVIESELKTSALSCVGALGPWQLMPETAQDLGLKITRQYDERTNYSKSTKAAALYLKDLYAKFGDWLLVLAAYNSGPGPVYAAIHKSGSKNFWALQNYLPAETRGHVKRFIATHYYFEGKGSVTTLTKAENIEYSKTVSSFTAAFAARVAAPIIATSIAAPIIATPIAAPITATRVAAPITSAGALQAPTSLPQVTATSASSENAHGKESSEQRFKRLMKDSEQSLQKSKQLIGG